MKKILLTIFAASMFIGVNAQDNNVKINLMNVVAMGDVRLGYERVINENLTVQGNLGFLVPRKVPTFFFDEEAVEAEYGGEIEFGSKATGYNLSFELRYYPGSKGAPRGFYLAPYLKHNHWGINVDAGFRYDVTAVQYADLTTDQQATAVPSADPFKPYTLTATGYYKGAFNQTGGGLMLGYQWLVSDKVSIDWNFFGLGIESDIVKLSLSTDAPDVDYQDWAEELDLATQSNSDFPVDVIVEVESDEIKIKTSRFILPMPRFGFSVGYAF